MYEENKEKRYCPFRKTGTVFHVNRDNHYIPKGTGTMRCIDHDIIEEDFLPCLQEKCMLYDDLAETCMMAKVNIPTTF